MKFAVVDIETTGGYAAENGITEIAVFVTDGESITDNFYAMLNPETPIPPFIETLTGITNERVQNQPVFADIAAELFEILKDKVFVAHNVNFDFSFVKYHLAKYSFDLNNNKLCTIRLGRKVIPGLKGYGLDKICNHLKIKIDGRHSAAGDAFATTKVLHYLLQKGGMKPVNELLKELGNNRSLPPNVSEENMAGLPGKPGVYFFHDKKGNVIYVGKAKNIRKRVKSHFFNNKPTKQKQAFLEKVYHISWEETATELMALVLEGIEIKKKWPELNKSQKHYEYTYGLYTYVDSAGYKRLFVEKKLRNAKPVYTFNYPTEGYTLLRKLIKTYELCPYLCFLTRDKNDCRLDEYHCAGACAGKETAEVYNKRVETCLEELRLNLPTFAIIDKGITAAEKSCILVEQGKLVGMGCIPLGAEEVLDDIKPMLTPYIDNAYVRSLLFRYAERHPYQISSFSGISVSR